MYGSPTPSVNRSLNGSFQIKVLIPKNAAASIIGKGGAVIKHMTEVSGCKFQLGDENDPYNTRERLVVLTASAVTHLVCGAQTIMAQLLEDPRVRTYSHLTTNYSPVSSSPTPSQPRPMSMPHQMSVPVNGGPHSPHMMGAMSPPPMMAAPPPYGIPISMAPPGAYAIVSVFSHH